MVVSVGHAPEVAPSLSQVELARLAEDQGLRPDGLVKQHLKRWAVGQLERVVDRVGDAYELAPAERDRLRAVLNETKDAKLREYWQWRAPLEAGAFAARSAAVTGVMLAIGLATPAALLPSAIGIAVGLAGQAVTEREMLRCALEGRAALELAHITNEQGGAPARRGWLARITERIARHVEARVAERFALDPPVRAAVGDAVEDARIQKQREVLELRTPLEVVGIAATAATAIGACVGFGLVGAASAVIMGASATLAGVATVGMSLWKLHAALGGAASAKLEELATEAGPNSELRARLDDAGDARSRVALAAASRTADKFIERFGLDAEEAAELDAILRRTARHKAKELGERLVPTVATPLGRGAAVATLAATAVASPPLATGAIVGSVADSAVSTGLLYHQLIGALDGAAYAYVKSLRRTHLEGARQSRS